MSNLVPSKVFRNILPVDLPLYRISLHAVLLEGASFEDVLLSRRKPTILRELVTGFPYFQNLSPCLTRGDQATAGGLILCSVVLSPKEIMPSLLGKGFKLLVCRENVRWYFSAVVGILGRNPNISMLRERPSLCQCGSRDKCGTDRPKNNVTAPKIHCYERKLPMR